MSSEEKLKYLNKIDLSEEKKIRLINNLEIFCRLQFKNFIENFLT